MEGLGIYSKRLGHYSEVELAKDNGARRGSSGLYGVVMLNTKAVATMLGVKQLSGLFPEYKTNDHGLLTGNFKLKQVLTLIQLLSTHSEDSCLKYDPGLFSVHSTPVIMDTLRSYYPAVVNSAKRFWIGDGGQISQEYVGVFGWNGLLKDLSDWNLRETYAKRDSHGHGYSLIELRWDEELNDSVVIIGMEMS